MIRMWPINRKSRLQRMIGAVADSLDLSSEVEALRRIDSSRALKTGLIAAGGLAGLTAGSAGVSSLRRHHEGASDDS
jgi:hypothetical protein